MENTALENPIELLRKKFHTVFESALIDEIIEHGEFMELDEGETIVRNGQYIKTIPLILSGSIKVLRHDEEGNDLILYFVQGGESCAMSLSCCMSSRKSAITAVTEEPTAIFSIPIQKMDEWTGKYNTWKTFVFRTYQLRFDELLNAIDSIAFDKLDQRLLKYLKEKAALAGSNILQLTHQHIASDLHSSREVITRLLKKLEKEGNIRSERNKIELMDH